ncbi:MAG: hypothetical protein IPP90_01925 [Gemmatimonadaceae bacterium]|nr:hypothetical protein [Gemmatimonadaceae bacterium]
MPVRLPPVTENASRLLLEGLVDYAGLFPPATLAMPAAVRNYAHYRAAGAGWMLGRFVCPAGALELFSQQADPLLPRDAGAIPWRLTATASDDTAADLAGIVAFNERHRVCFEECGALVDAYEVRLGDAKQLATLDAMIPRDLVTYFEIPFAAAPELLPRVADLGRRAKMRTGGIVASAFPASEAIASFLKTCFDHEIVAKATAGLHHPISGPYRLTYDADAPSGRMYGFLNVFLTAALLVQGADVTQAVRLLDELDAASVSIDEVQITWRSDNGAVVLDRETLQRVRERLLVSFGSCSFTEPVTEIRAMGWL